MASSRDSTPSNGIKTNPRNATEKGSAETPMHGRGSIPSSQEIMKNTRRARTFKSNMIHVLRERLDRALPSDLLLQNYLSRSGWNLGKAEDWIQEEFRVSKVRNDMELPGRQPSKVDSDFLLGAGSTHESHRRAVDSLYRLANLRGDSNGSLTLTTLELALLLNRNAWVVESAMPDVFYHQLNASARMNMDRKLRQLRVPTNTQLNRDRRLALFLEISGTDDAFSAHHFLHRHGYDLGVTVDSWMRGGLPTLQPLKASKSKGVPVNGHPRTPHVERDNRWPDDRPVAQPFQSMDEDEIETSEDNEENRADTPDGFLIRYDNHPARIGMPNPRKLEIESVRNGKYRRLRYGGTTIPGSGTIGQHGRETGRKHRQIDWNDNEDIVELNKWYNQPRRRITKNLRRTQPLKYVEHEHSWLYQWYRRTYDNVLNENPHYQAEGGRWPLPLDRKLLEEQFNAEFRNRMNIPGSEGVPRPERKANSLMIYSSRQKDWCAEFGFRYTQAHKPRRSKVVAAAGADERSSEATEEEIVEEEAGTGASVVESSHTSHELSLDEADLFDDEDLEALREVNPVEYERISRICKERDNRMTARQAARFASDHSSERSSGSDAGTGAASLQNMLHGRKRRLSSRDKDADDGEEKDKSAKRRRP